MAHLFYSGRVQGVGFRYTAAALAREYGIVGWVRNLRDGAVELVCEAEEEKVKKFIAALSQEMSHYIKDVSDEWSPATGEFDDFSIKFL